MSTAYAALQRLASAAREQELKATPAANAKRWNMAGVDMGASHNARDAALSKCGCNQCKRMLAIASQDAPGGDKSGGLAQLKATSVNEAPRVLAHQSGFIGDTRLPGENQKAYIVRQLQINDSLLRCAGAGCTACLQELRRRQSVAR